MGPIDNPLLDFPLLVGMRSEYQVLIAECAGDVEYAKGQHLFVEGEPATGCWLVQGGRVAIQTRRAGLPPMTIETLGLGDVAGWSWLVPPHRWRFSAVALTTVRAALLDTEPLRNSATIDPSFGQALSLAMLRTLAQRLEHTRRRLLDIDKPPPGRAW